MRMRSAAPDPCGCLVPTLDAKAANWFTIRAGRKRLLQHTSRILALLAGSKVTR